jgi:PEGA domain-containing protein
MFKALPKFRMMAMILGVFLLVPVCVFSQDNRVMGQLRFQPHGWINKTAGVWVDGQYVGYVKELHGDRTIFLLPGKHLIEVREAGYRDLTDNLVVSPGNHYDISVDLMQVPQPPDSSSRAAVDTFVSPGRAAVFVDGMYVGHANEFRGNGNELLLIPGKRKIVITLPGYQAFSTEVSLLPNQRFQLAVQLKPGSVLKEDEDLDAGTSGSGGTR